MENEVKNGRYEDKYGDVHWYKDGQLHREDGPAVEYEDGEVQWYKDGQLHRDDGPAIEYAYGYKEWWLNGVLHTEKKFNQWLAKKKLNENFHQTPEEKQSIKKAKI